MAIRPVRIQHSCSAIPLTMTLKGQSQIGARAIAQVDRQKQLNLSSMVLRNGHPIATLRKSDTVLHCTLKRVSRRQRNGRLSNLLVRSLVDVSVTTCLRFDVR